MLNGRQLGLLRSAGLECRGEVPVNFHDSPEGVVWEFQEVRIEWSLTWEAIVVHIGVISDEISSIFVLEGFVLVKSHIF